MNSVISLFLKPRHGEPPVAVQSLEVTSYGGIRGDCFAGGGERQVSIVTDECLSLLQSSIYSGLPCVKRFTFNMLLPSSLPLKVGTRLCIGDAALEITMCGRRCHEICQLHLTGDECPLVRGCFFARVLSDGTISKGDSVDYV